MFLIISIVKVRGREKDHNFQNLIFNFNVWDSIDRKFSIVLFERYKNKSLRIKVENGKSREFFFFFFQMIIVWEFQQINLIILIKSN